MRPADGAVLLVLMVLLTAARSMSPKRTTELYGRRTIETTIETTTEPITTVCPTITCDDPRCFLEYGPDGCPIQCICGDPICMLNPCGPDEECVPSYENPGDYICVSKYGNVCPDISGCVGTCHVDYKNIVDGCPRCICVDPVCGWLVQCDPDEDCVPCDNATFGHCCVSKNASSTPSTTPSETTTDRCPPLICIGPCQLATDSNGCTYCNCQPTPSTTPSVTTTVWCPTVTCNQGCHTAIDFNGCTYCECPPSCEGVYCAYGEKCELLPTSCAPSEYPCYPRPACVPITDTTTTTPNRPTPTATTQCPIPPCARGCRLVPGPVEGCYIGCKCPYSTCEETTCDPGQVCVMKNDDCPDWETIPCFRWPTCVSSTDTTATTPTTSPCIWPRCAVECLPVDGPNGCLTCQCPNYTCQGVLCREGKKCELLPPSKPSCNPWEEPCMPKPVCVPITDTTPLFCPMIECGPDCDRYYRASDGCATCKCPPSCQNVTCDPGYVCQLKKVWCVTTPCYPQPRCIAVQETTTPCPVIDCYPPCVSDKVSYRCPTCVCPPSCQGYECSSGYECQLVDEVPCDFVRPCFPQPKCVPKQETTTPCPMIECYPPCVPDIVSYRCPKCACPPSCQGYECSSGYECQLVDVSCNFTGPCFPQPKCVPKQETTTPCPMIKCAPDCVTYTESHGCPTCACPRVCNLLCIIGYECVLVNVTCKQYPCFPEPQCVPKQETTTPCPLIKCAPYCVSDTGSDGCPTCACPPSCKTVKCSAGYECQLVNVTCVRYPCFPQPQCLPINNTTAAPCRMYKCAPNCVPGKGPDGCPTCECPPSCETVKCSAGHECQLVNVTCIRYPCFPQPQCVPTENPCKGTPNTRRCGRFRNRWTYNSVTNKCEKFRYYGCTPSLNTFLSPKACKNKCQGSAQIVCPAVVCEKNCYTFTRKNKCPKCICPNPCEGFECHYGDECKLQEAECEDEDPEPFCTLKPCPAQKGPCVIRCEYGFKADKNGCLLCACLEERSPYY